MLAKDEVFLNQVAQGVHDLDAALRWFAPRAASDRLDVLENLGQMAIQAGATDRDATTGACLVGVEHGATPVVLMSKAPPRVQLRKLMRLPAVEYEAAFLLLLGMFICADRRRRGARCKGQCGHWWHRDLADESVVAEVLAELLGTQ